MLEKDEFRVVECTWRTNETELTAIRTEVFIREQNVPESEEMDDIDPLARHYLVFNPAGEAVATARYYQSKIGRIAVLKAQRGLGLGALLLDFIIKNLPLKDRQDLSLNAQTYAIPFYEKMGFVGVGEIFMDANIEHIKMIYKNQS